jgi:membrane protease YdiL (CAAX protease family)
MDDQANPPPAPWPGQTFLRGRDGRPRPIWRAVLFFLMGAFLVTVGNVLTIFALNLIWPGTDAVLAAADVPPLRLAVPIFAVRVAVLLLCSWLFLSTLDQRSFRTLGISFYGGWMRELLMGAVLGAGLMLLVAGALVAGGWLQYGGRTGNAAAVLPQALGFALFLALPAAGEEFVARGYLFQRVLDAWGPLWATLVLSLFFGFAHLGNPSVTALSTINTVLAGVLLAVAYLKTRALWLPVGLHWAWNAAMGPGLSLPVSGLQVGPPIFSVQTAGPQWLSGGNYGPEGSIVLTGACIGAIVLLWRARWLTPSPAMREVLQ